MRVSQQYLAVLLLSVVAATVSQAQAQQFLTAVSLPTATNAYVIAAADYNEDGILDMAVVNYNGGATGIVSMLIGDGDGTFQPAVNYNAGLGPRFIASGDFNGDGHLDVVIANELSDSVSV